MKIDYSNGRAYYDMNGEQIHDGDKVLMDGRLQTVKLTDDGHLGTDSTNPMWLVLEMASECEYGIYPFNATDEPVKPIFGEYTGVYGLGDVIYYRGHRLSVIGLWNANGINGVTVRTGELWNDIDMTDKSLQSLERRMERQSPISR